MAREASVGDFVDALGEHIENLGIGFTRGENLFEEIDIEDSEKLPATSLDETLILFDEGYPAGGTSFGYKLIEWSVRLQATRSTREKSIEALRAPINGLVSAGPFTATGFAVKSVRVDTAPEFAARLENGRFQAQAILVFTVIPTGS